MARFLINPLYYDPGVPFSGIVPVSLGGTGQSTVSGVLSSFGFLDRTKANVGNGYVRLNAGLIPTSVIPTGANGVALTDSNNLIPKSAFGTIVVGGVTLVGPLSVVVGQMVTYTITNYDAFTTYNVSASAGSISIAGATIAYTAPSSAGSVTITINGRSATLNVVASVVNTPMITAPVNGATGISRKPTFTKSSFSVTGQAQTQTGVRWELSTDPAFTTLVDSYEGTSNYTNWMPSVTLSNLTTYYVRVKDQGSISGYSAWSPVVSFTTVQQVNFVTVLSGASNCVFNDTITLNDYLYVVGYQSTQGRGSNDALIAKYDTNGNLIWQRALGGGADDQFRAITTDRTHLYAIGYLASQGKGGIDILVTKYDTNGNLVWQRALGTPNSDAAYGIVYLDQYLYVTGDQLLRSSTVQDAFIAKYDTNGTLIWQRGLNESNDTFFIKNVVCNSYIYAIGRTFSSTLGDQDAIIVKYDTNGNLIWQRALGGSGTDVFTNVTTDGAYLYAVGYQKTQGQGNSDIILVKYDQNGGVVWQRGLGGSNEDSVFGILYADNYVYISGHQKSQTSSGTALLVAKYDLDGNLIWQRSLDGATLISSSSIAFNGVYLYITGYLSLQGQSNNSAFIISLPASGSFPLGPLTGSGLTWLSWTQPTLTAYTSTLTVYTPTLTAYTPSLSTTTPTLIAYTPTLPTLYSTF